MGPEAGTSSECTPKHVALYVYKKVYLYVNTYVRAYVHIYIYIPTDFHRYLVKLLVAFAVMRLSMCIYIYR